MDESPEPPAEEASTEAPQSKPKAYSVGTLPGGTLPDPGQLIQETLAEFMDHIGPYAMAGLGQFMVVMPLTLVAVIVVYIGMFGGMAVVMVGGALISMVIMETLGETLGGIAMVLTQLLSFAVPIVMLGAMVAGMVAVLGPMHASMARAVAAHQRGEKELELTAAFSTATQDIGPVLIAALLVGAMTSVGLMFCVLPAMAVPLVVGFAIPLVALGGLGGVASVRTALQHTLAHPSWHLTFGLLYVVITMVAANIPIVGAAFAVALHVRAYRTVFGDGPEPVLTVS